MPARNSPLRYGSVAQSLHWLIVALLIVQVTLGEVADGLPNGLDKLAVLARHKSFGITILALAIARLCWRLFDPPPPPPPMPRWQLLVARLNHWALYALLFLLPLSGWLYNSASGYPLQWFKLVSLPSLTRGRDNAVEAFAHAMHEWGFYLQRDDVLKAFAHDVHEWGFYLLVLLLIAHVGAALKHHVIDRDDTLVRMLPLLRRRGAAPIPAAS